MGEGKTSDNKSCGWCSVELLSFSSLFLFSTRVSFWLSFMIVLLSTSHIVRVSVIGLEWSRGNWISLTVREAKTRRSRHNSLLLDYHYHQSREAAQILKRKLKWLTGNNSDDHQKSDVHVLINLPHWTVGSVTAQKQFGVVCGDPLSFTQECHTWISHTNFVHEFCTWISHMNFVHEFRTWISHMNFTYKLCVCDAKAR